MILVTALPAMATEKVHFFNILVDRTEQGLRIKTKPESLLDYKFIKDDDYNIDKSAHEYTLDALFRQTAFLMRTLERNRGSIHKDKESFLPILKYGFELALRDVTGEVIEMKEYDVVLGLSPEEETGWISVDEGRIKHPFKINQLTQQDEYDQFINNLVFPHSEVTLPLPAQDEYLVDLYYKWPRTVVPESDFNVFDLFPSGILWDKGVIKKLKIHLGTTYSYKDGDQWKQVQSEHLRHHKRSIEQYGHVLETAKGNDLGKTIVALEEYVSTVPGDRKALKRLMDAYLKDLRNDEAFNLISRFQPFFATIREGLPNQKSLAMKAERRRNWLLGNKSTFAKNEAVTLGITSPVDGDLVTGTTQLTFSLAGNESPILEIECYLEEQLIAKLTAPPFETKFTVDGSYGNLNVRVVAYFEDETFQEDQIRVSTLKVDEEERVNLVGIRASIFQPKAELSKQLTKEDFQVKENKVVKQVENFKKDTAPLRVAILLDTSISMFGDKLYKAQYAVKTFISKLEPEDRVSIFSFDNKVLKLSDFTNDFDAVVPQLMTLSPQWATSLYDSMLIAHDALLGQNGTKVMIVVSDGDDSMSATNDIHVASVLRNSPVMVYSIILPGGFLGASDKGEYFLKEMARLSGSMSIKLNKVSRLDETFDRLYIDLKSFYYLDYYTDYINPADRELAVRVKGVRGRVRFRAVN